MIPRETDALSLFAFPCTREGSSSKQGKHLYRVHYTQGTSRCWKSSLQKFSCFQLYALLLDEKLNRVLAKEQGKTVNSRSCTSRQNREECAMLSIIK